MQHIIVHGKNNPYSDLYLIILMIALELCWWWLLINIPCVPIVIYISPCAPWRPRCSCVPVSQSSFIVDKHDDSRHINMMSVDTHFPVVICVPVSQSVISLWLSRSSFIFPVSRSVYAFVFELVYDEINFYFFFHFFLFSFFWFLPFFRFLVLFSFFILVFVCTFYLF